MLHILQHFKHISIALTHELLFVSFVDLEAILLFSVFRPSKRADFMRNEQRQKALILSKCQAEFTHCKSVIIEGGGGSDCSEPEITAQQFV